MPKNPNIIAAVWDHVAREWGEKQIIFKEER